MRAGDGFVAKSMLREAVIEYRNATQIDARRSDIRLKLADTLMMLADPAGAMKEYVRAADLAPDDATVQVKAGAMMLANRSFEDAKAFATKALAKDPKNVPAQILLGNALAGLKDQAGAIEEYQLALALDPKNATAYGNIATIQLAQGDREAAEASFRKTIEMAPQSVPARLAFANFLWVNDRLPETEQMLKAALELDPEGVPTNRALGSFYMATDRRAEAEPYFRAIAKAATTPAARLGLVDYYVYSQRFDEARKILSELQQTPQLQDAALLRLAAVDAAEGDRAQAMARAREVVVKRPKEMTARVLIARLLLADKKRDEALAEASAIVKEDSTSAVAGEAYMLMGDIYAATGRYEEADRTYQEVMKRQVKPIAAVLALARLRYAAGDLDSALSLVRQALTMQPRNPDARALQVRIFLARKDLRQAKEIMASLEKDYPRTLGILDLRGEVMVADGRLDAAAAAYASALELTPSDNAALNGLVRIELLQGRKQEAVKRVEAALQRHLSGDFLLVAARTYAAVGDRQNAEEALIRAIKLEPERLEAYSLLGALYAGQNRLLEAREKFEQAVKRDPKSVALNTALGMLMETQGKGDEAEAQYKRVLAIDSRAPVAANNLAWMYVSRNQNLDEAIALAQVALESMPDDPNVNDTLGWIYYRKKLTDMAIRYLEASVAKRQTDAATFFHLGMAYADSGLFDKAKKSLHTALTLDANFEHAAEARSKLDQLGL